MPASCSSLTLELTEIGAGALRLCRLRGVSGVRTEESEGVVPPVVAQALFDESLLGDEGLHGEQLHGRDPEVLEVADGGLVGEPRVRSPQLLGNARIELGQPLEVRLVDHRIIERGAGLGDSGPVERLVDDHGALRTGAEALDALAVRIQEKPRRVESVRGPLRAGDAEVVAAAGHEFPGASEPDAVPIPREIDGLVDPVRVLVVEQAQVDFLGILRPDADLAPVGGEANAHVGEGIGDCHAS
jgi:hypothetical protein